MMRGLKVRELRKSLRIDRVERADAFIRQRNFSENEVAQVNFVLKNRARRFIAAGKEEWLYPEEEVERPWSDFADLFHPPEDELWRFGGEIYMRYDDGRVQYQDEYGRPEKRWEILEKHIDRDSIQTDDECGCGSGKNFGPCCAKLPDHLRPSWSELSIRERNIMFSNFLVQELVIS